MEEFKDAEEELPFEEYFESTSILSKDSLSSNPHPPDYSNTDRMVDDASSLDQKSPVSLSEFHDSPLPHTLNKESISKNSMLSSEITAVPHSLPDPMPPILQDDSKEMGNVTVHSTAFSSEVHGIPLQHPLPESPSSQEKSSVSGTISVNDIIISPTSSEISMESGSIPGSTTRQSSEIGFPVSHSSVDSATSVPPLNSNVTTIVAENPTSLSSEVHSVPPPYQPDGGSSVGVDEIRSNNINSVAGETKKSKEMKHFELNNHQRVVGNSQNETTKAGNSSGHAKQPTVHRGLVDTTAPFESVKEAVTMFGGIVDWKAHRVHALERRKQLLVELEKVQEEIPDYKNQAEAAENAKTQVLEELNSTKRLVEELKLNLEKAQTEEAQAKQDSELVELRAKEIEQGIADEASVAVKAQLDVARARHEAAAVELKSVKTELEELQRDYVSLLEEKDVSIKKAEEAVLESKEIEKTVEDLTLELIAAKESLESSHAAHLEAEEHRIGAALARDQDFLNWEKELKQAEEDLVKANEQLLSAKDLKEKLDSASALLHSLNCELATYMESKLKEELGSGDGQENELQTVQKELEEVKAAIEKTRNEINILRAAESSFKLELETEKAGLANMRQREGMASIAVASVEAEIERTKKEIKLALAKEKEARGMMVELPKLLQQAAHNADIAKSDAQTARDELRKAKEDAEQSKAAASTAEIRLSAALKEIEAAKASERLAVLTIKALQESEGEELSDGVTIPIEEFYSLSKRAHEVEELSNERVSAAVAEIEVAKESERKTLDKLEEACKEMSEKKEALRVAMEKAEKAKEGKLGVEQELRKWRAEHEQKRRASNAAAGSGVPPKSPTRSLETQPKSFKYADVAHPAPNAKMHAVDNKAAEHNGAELNGRKKKKSFFPRILLLLARKKAQTL